MTMLSVAERSPARSQAERAYWLLIDRITRLELPPGAVLLDRELTEQLGIGRTPVREALQRLSAEGLVTHYPHRGMAVSEITAPGTRDIYEFRSLVDGEASKLSALRRSDEEAEQFGALSLELQRLSDGRDIDRYVAVDREFYELLGEASRNAYIAETLRRMFNLHLRLWFFISKRTGSWAELLNAHSGMVAEAVEAIVSRNPDAAALALRAYIAQRQRDMRVLI